MRQRVADADNVAMALMSLLCAHNTVKILYFYLGMILGAAATFVIVSAVPEITNQSLADGFLGSLQQLIQSFRAYFSEMTRNF